MSWQDILKAYLAVGVLVLCLMLAGHLWTFLRETEEQRRWRKVLQPSYVPFRDCVRDFVFIPFVVGVAAVIAWPVAVVMFIRDRMGMGQRGYPAPEEFSVRRVDLQEQISVDEIQDRERVRDPQGAVSGRPFGHLNGAWKVYLAGLPEDAQLWSFQREWDNGKHRSPLCRGYVAVHDGKIGPWFFTVK